MRRFGKIILFALYTALVFGVGTAVGWGGGGFLTGAVAGTPENIRTEAAPLWEVWNIINTDYFEQPLDKAALIDGAIEGMLATLDDRNTRYLNPEEQALDMADMDGEFQGIGARIDYVEGKGVVVVSPIVGSPAAAAGLKPGDIILEADGVALTDVDNAVRLVRGEAGTPVTLLLERDGEQFELKVTRGVISVPSVTARMLDDEIAYLQLTQFGSDSAETFAMELDDLLAQSPRGLVVDLRNNPGGLLTAVVDIADLFLDEGVIMTEEFGNGEERVYESEGGDSAETIPLVVLVNEGSASASEVFAGAIEARDRGEIVGVQSFGKGTVQTVRVLTNGGGVRVTIAHWLTPDGDWIHEAGVTPDLVVERGEDFEAVNPETGLAENDDQLNAAIELLESTLP